MHTSGVSPSTRTRALLSLIALALAASAMAPLPGASHLAVAQPPQEGTIGVNATCQDCHVGPSHLETGSSMAIGGVPETFDPGHKYTITVTLVRGRGPQPIWDIVHGFQLHASRGHLDITDTAGMVSRGSLDVASAGAVEATSWTMVWTAPEDEEDVDFFAEAVVGDGDGTADGDVAMEADAHSYGPLSVPPEDEPGPWAGRWPVIAVVGASAILAGYALAFTYRRPPPTEEDY
jgi:hypothetical protein